MKQALANIYRDLSAGRLTQQEALARIRALKQPRPVSRAVPHITLQAAPRWEAAAPTTAERAALPATRRILLHGLPPRIVETLASRFPDSRCESLPEPEGSPARDYAAVALAVFEQVQDLLRGTLEGGCLLQLVFADEEGAELYAGLAGLFETAALENPGVVGQILFVEPDVTADVLAHRLEAERADPRRRQLRYQGATRLQRRWGVVDTPADSGCPFRERGVYLVTGGLGGLGLLLAREILAQTSAARVVLCGRSAPANIEDALNSLAADGRAEYRQTDVADAEQVRALIDGVLRDHGRLDGVVHAAGVLRDDFILRKTAAQFEEVLRPKLTGSELLDLATRALPLDFFLLFSSIAVWAGNVGQADYAAANGFLDGFAATRAARVAAGERHGKTLSIAWPHWLDGGMNIDALSMAQLERRTGLRSMTTADGMAALRQALASPLHHLMVMHGDGDAMRRALEVEEAPRAALAASPANAAVGAIENLLPGTREFLRRQFAEVLKVPPARIETEAPLEQYGIDSILAMSLTAQLETRFGALPKTLFFEYQTLDQLAAYLLRAHAAKLAALLAPAAGAIPSHQPTQAAAMVAAPPQPSARRARRRSPVSGAVPHVPATSQAPIAIVGLSGRYPAARDLEAFWHNLREGRDCIVEVPRERWDWRDHYSDDRTREGAHFSKWGGFIEGADEFDPRFFNIAPREARGIDPQERLFLQHAWMAIEDAGLTRASLQVPDDKGLPGQVGVYAGVMYGEYNLSGSLASIANRVSYFLNLHGPSMTLDTMCSSSLTAIHLACQDLRLGRTALALAGGVNLSIHPNKYAMLSGGQFISGDGHCQSFGEGGDGYIPGEGVGVVVLKRLAEAERDGNHIYGVIRGSALNHGGKTNGYTVPNPQAQAEVIRRALAEAGVDPREMSYIEAHGTGTKLGDPIEIAALTRAFHESGPATVGQSGFCLIGSAKSNIGHCESAAGVAGLSKVLLQMKHGMIVPSLHSRRLNPHIDFAATPFVVVQALQPWRRPIVAGRERPRLAGISSFGAGGSNAHLIVEEYRTTRPAIAPAAGPRLLPLSARSAEQLTQRARDLLAFLESGAEPDLAALAWTLQTGREAMDERAAFIADSVSDFVARLRAFLRDEPGGASHRAQVRLHKDALAERRADPAFVARLENWIAARELAPLAELWAQGLDLDWRRLAPDETPRLIGLPTYPFARESYWIAPASATVATARRLHPLLHANASNLAELCFRSRFDGREAFLADADKRLPPLLALEMLRAALELAAPAPRDAQAGGWMWRDTVWAEALHVTGETELGVTLLPRDAERIDLEIRSGPQVLCQSHAVRERLPAPPRLDLNRLRAGLRTDGDDLFLGAGQALATLNLATSEATANTDIQPLLSPSLLQALTELIARVLGGPAQAAALASLRVRAAPPARPVAWLRVGDSGTLDIDLCDEQGLIFAQLGGLRLSLPADRVRATEQLDSAAGLPAAPAATPIAEEQAERDADAKPPSPALPREISLFVTHPGDVQAFGPVPAKPDRIGLNTVEAPIEGARSVKPRLRLAPPAASLSAPHGADADSAVRLFEEAEGVFALDIQVPLEEVIGPLAQALTRVAQEASARVLLLRGRHPAAWQGGREACDRASERGLFGAVAAFPLPTIAVVDGGARGAGLLLAAACDFVVGDSEALYGFSDADQGLFPGAEEDAFFRQRLGDTLADELLYRGEARDGAALRALGWAARFVPSTFREDEANTLAAALAEKPRLALELLKAHLGRALTPLAAALRPVGAAYPGEQAAEPRVLHPSAAVDGHSQVQELIEALEHAAEGSGENAGCPAVVIVGGGPDFLSELADTETSAARFAALAARVRACPVPVIAALDGDAQGPAWLFALVCDAVICRRDGRYAAGATLAREAAAWSALRLGSTFGYEFALTDVGVGGEALRERAVLPRVVEEGELVPEALRLAARWRVWPRPALQAWKRIQDERLQALREALPDVSAELADEVGEAPAGVGVVPLASEVVELEVRADGVAILRLQDRAAKNMFSPALVEGLRETFAHFAEAPGCKAVVMVGFDSYFATGGTVDTLLAIQEGQARFTDEKIFQAAMDCPLPVVAAIQGHAIGGGWSFGMFADFVLLSAESRYLSPYMGYGFTPGAGSTLMLPAKLGHDLARESLLTAREATGQALAERGVALPVLPRKDVLPEALALAERLARLPRARLLALKRMWTQPLRDAREEVYRRELDMHERTFVRNAETLATIQIRFGESAASATQSAARPAANAPSRSASDASSAPPTESVVDTLKAMLAQELFLRPEEIDEDTQFIELGLDSITGVTWIRKINARYGTDIEATKVYSHPTLKQLSRLVAGESRPTEEAPIERMAEAPSEPSRAAETLPAIVARLRDMLAKELLLPAQEIEENAQFIDLGLDSITGVTWVRKINEHYRIDIEATKVYSHPTLGEIARLVRGEAMRAGTLPAPVAPVVAMPAAVPPPPVAPTPLPLASTALPRLVSWRGQRAAVVSEPNEMRAPVAIIGMAGQFAQARDIHALWRNLAEGRDCIVEVPAARWDAGHLYQPGAPTAGKTNSKWLGALENYDQFDPLFFNISPTEAECMEPQQRLFLQACWHGIENAGYSAASLSGSQCGVFVGCGPSEYHQVAPAQQLSAQGFTGAASSILAARIAYFLNLRGPCLAIETACSSSLVAIASACDSLNAGHSDLALAGGVYVMAGPAMHIMTAQAGMLSVDGRCFSFDQRANGFVPGEGVGVLLLKRLADARRDGDRILSVIEGWGVNQDGKTNGITAPNEESQTRLLQSVYRRFGIDPAGIQLIEAHGTGTKLGDPIEVSGLKAAFAPFTDKTGYCALGSVKSNIGHCLTAAGVAGAIKLVMAMRHRQLPPTIHYRQCNEHIRLAASPFFVNDRLRPWDVAAGERRRAAVSSFGFSGTNAHLVLVEPPPAESRPRAASLSEQGRLALPLSARTEAQLRRKAQDLLAHLRRHPELDMTELACTLQLGRDGMDERLGFLAADVESLAAQLEAWLAGRGAQAGVFEGQVRRNRDELKLIAQDAEMRAAVVGKWLAESRLSKLLSLWVKGLDFDWSQLYGEHKPARIELPGYPFAEDRYWLEPLAPSFSDAPACEARAVSPPAPQSIDPGADELDMDEPETTLSAPRWDVVRAFDPASASAAGRVLAIGADAAQRELLARQHGAARLTCIDLKPDDEVEAIARRLEAIEFDSLVWIASAQPVESLDEESIVADQARGIMQVLRIARALVRLGREKDGLAWDLVTTACLPVRKGERVNPTHAGLQGFCGSMAEVYPHWRIRLLDLHEWSAAAVAGIDRLPHRARAACYALRGAEWYEQKLVPVTTLPDALPPYREGGVYVVVGGAGGLGEIWSRHLIRDYAANVVWLGRRPLDADIQRKIDALALVGKAPEYIQCDASDRESLETAYRDIKRRHPVIHGVVHSAVGAFDQSLKTVSEADFRAILSVKIDLSVRLAQVFAREALDFLLFFSSNASFVRGAGMSGYSAGCAFKDAFAVQLAQRWNRSVKVVNWGYWSVGAGEAMTEAMKTYFYETGYRPLDPDEAMRALDRFLASGLEQISIGRKLRAAVDPLAAPDEWIACHDNAPRGGLPAVREIQALRFADRFEGLRAKAGQEMEPLLSRLLRAILRATPDVLPGYARWLAESEKIAAPREAVESESLDRLWAEWDAALREWTADEGKAALCQLVDRAMRALPDVLTGRQKATDVLFPHASLEFIERVYKTERIGLAFNESLRDTLLVAVRARLDSEPGVRLRLLEIGAGTGATTVGILDALAPLRARIAEYAYTDLSKAFLFHAETHYAPGAPYLRTFLFDVERPLEGQGIDAGAYDFVIAANVVHATRNIRNTLRNAKAVLRRDGMLLLNEISERSLCGHVTFGLLDGWWLNEDDEVRIPGSPGLYPEAWKQVLEEEGFHSVLFPCEAVHALGQQIVVASSDGQVRQRRARTSARPAASPLARIAVRPVVAGARAVQDDASWLDSAAEFCRKLVARALKMDAAQIDIHEPLERYGIDSISIGLVNQQLQRHFGDIGATLLYEHRTVAALAAHLLATQRPALSRLLSMEEPRAVDVPTAPAHPVAQETTDAALREKALQFCKQLIARALKMDSRQIDAHESLERYGIDSISVGLVNQQLQRHFGDVGATLLYEHQTVAALTEHLLRTQRETLHQLFAVEQPAPTPALAPRPAPVAASPALRVAPVAPSPSARGGRQPIAIVGISGLYPMAANLEAFWDNLKAGRDCVGEIPPSRWTLDGFYEPDEQRAVEQGRSYCKWGGFVEQFAEFDTLFFGIPPREALNMDPQERLFMQSAWSALENAGYTRATLKRDFHGRVGVFAGITRAGYNLYRDTSRNEDKFWPRTSFSSVANRLSYFLDIHGPSLPVDTMCSSSLTAIHEACEHIHNGDCELALAGGVNLYLHPTSYVDMSSQHMLSLDGRCRSFGAGANGFVPGEGVGVVLLKPLDRALADQDIVHGLILATQVNHGGKTNGFTVPNPVAQAELIRQALDKAGISAREVSYIEAHGTGTELGDPIEVAGLQQAFARDTRDTAFCRLGSAKSNLGHLEAAAGIAGLTKVLLQLRHRQIAPSLHADALNPHLRLEQTAFVLNRALSEWEQPVVDGCAVPRIAGISSFGAGGANAHVIVQEFAATAVQSAARDPGSPVIVPLSAKTPEQLQQKASELLDYLGRADSVRDLDAIAYTLQVGREAMELRLGLVVSSLEALRHTLGAIVYGEEHIEGVWRGSVQRHNESMALFAQDEEMREAIDKWIARRKYGKLVELWVKGLDFEWQRLYADGPHPRRIELPTYPFAKETYWLDSVAASRPAPQPAAPAQVPVASPDLHLIEDIIARIDAASLEATEGVQLLKKLV